MKNKIQKTAKIIARIVLISIVSVFIGLGLYRFNAVYVAGDSLPMPLGYAIAVVLSGSMEPTLSVNDVVLVKKCDTYEVGDIVVYQSGKSLVIHKIVCIDGETITTQGEANNVADEPFTVDAIKGKMINKIGGAGILLNVLEHPIVKSLLFAGAVFLLWISYRKEKEQNAIDEIKNAVIELKKELGKEQEINEK